MSRLSSNPFLNPVATKWVAPSIRRAVAADDLRSNLASVHGSAEPTDKEIVSSMKRRLAVQRKKLKTVGGAPADSDTAARVRALEKLIADVRRGGTQPL